MSRVLAMGVVAGTLLVAAGCNDLARDTTGSQGAGGESPLRQALGVDDAVRITAKWEKLGGAAVVGAATSVVQDAPGGLGSFQTFANGVIVYTNDFGAVYLSQAIFDKWLSLQTGTTGDGSNLYTYVGRPTQDFIAPAGRQEGTFERGRIIVAAGVARLVHGAIYGRYIDLGAPLGLPVDEEAGAAGGRFQRFERGEIHAKAGLGTFGVWGAIRDRWVALGGPGGTLGFPRSDVANVTSTSGTTLIGVSSRFEKGAIFHSAGAGAWEVTGDILTDYEKRFGGPAGWLGFPISGQGVAASGDQFNDFEHGVLVNHLAADSFKGVRPFGSFDFFLERIEGFGDDCWLGLCGEQDIYAYLTVSTPAGPVVNNLRLPSGGDYGDDSKELNRPFDLPGAVARSSLRVDVSIEVRDYDSISANDHLGTVTESYSIDNLWGAMLDHRHRSDNGAATFTVRSTYPFDRGDFRGQLWWSFENFSTDVLSYNQFATTFVDVSPDEATWRHPFNKLFYELAYKKIAKNGNCFGMALESIYAQTNRSSYAEPIHQYFPDTETTGAKLTAVDAAHAALMNELNIKHGYQLSANGVAWFLGMFLTGLTHDPNVNFLGASLAHALGDYPMIAIYDSYLFGNGHVIRPYEFVPVTTSCPSGAAICSLMKIADPNNPTGTDPIEEPLEVSTLTNSFRYRDYSGNFLTGGRMFFMPFSLFSHAQRTPLDGLLQLLDNGFLFALGTTGKTNQIIDGSGNTFFKTGLGGPPTLWDDIRREDDPARVANLAPIVPTDALPSTSPIQMFAGRGLGATHTYEVVPAPGLPSGTPVEATFDSGRMAAAFVIPGTPGKPDRITAHEIGGGGKAVSLSIPMDGQPKTVSWTVSGAQKQRWAELSGLKMMPAQSIGIRLGNAGFDLTVENNGPATSADLRVKAGPGATPVVVGRIDIPGGASTVQYQLPVTTLTLSNEVPGRSGWLVAPVTVTLVAKDFSGTGIEVIEYGRSTTVWTPYTGPFVYGDEGATSLYYRARDNARNQELPKAQPLKIDTRPPVVVAFTDQPTYTRIQPFVVHYSASDPVPGSGLDAVVATLDGSPVSDAQSVDLLWFALGSHTLTATATDVAGLTTARSAAFEVVATLGSLQDLIRELRRRGEIDSDGIMQSLLAKAEAAAHAAARGQRTPALNQLSALLRELAAQSGKHVTARAADLLAADVRYVMAHLP